MSERWKPIKTAPKDGTAILVYDGDSITTARWEKPFASYSEWQLIRCGSYADDGDCFPTHWRPLPPPPKSRTKKARSATN